MRTPGLGTAIATLALALIGSVSAFAADTVTVRAVSGQSYEGWIVDAADTHAYQLEDFAPQRWSVTVKAVKGSSFVPDVTLEDPASVDVTSSFASKRTQTSRTVEVTKATFPSGEGRYVLRVRSRNGSVGAYRVKISAKVQTEIRGEGAVVGAPTDISFFLPTEARASLKVTPKLPGNLSPSFMGVTPPGGLVVGVVRGPKAGQAWFSAPVAGQYTVTVGGAGATAGAFGWVAKVTPAKPTKFPVRVNAGAAYYPAPGPAPASTVTTSGQAVVGFASDGVELCWREVRTKGGGNQGPRNSVTTVALDGDGRQTIANNFASDLDPPLRGLGFGPTHAAVVATDQLYAVPRSGGSDVVLEAFVGTVLRLLVDADNVYVLRADALRAYPLGGGGFTPLPVAAGTLRDMCFGSRGLVYAVETAGGALEVRTITVAGTDDGLLTSIDPAVTLTALAARGGDVFVATDDGVGGHQILRIPAVGGGTPVPIHTGGVVTAMAVDEFNVYGIEDDPTDGGWVRQYPRGGGVAQVLVRDSVTSGFIIDGSNVCCGAGRVFFLADASGTDTFLRVKRR